MNRLLVTLSMLAACHAALAQPWSFTRIVDSDTNIPGTSTLKFDGPTSFQYVSVYANRVAFLGQAKSGNGYGVYEWQSGVGRTIANKNTIVPGGTTKIQVYHEINATSRGVTFYAAAPDNSGVFYEDGTSLGHVADRMDSIPDGNGKFTGIDFHHHSVGTSTAFAGRNDASGQAFGIYRSDEGAISRIADKTMSPPGHAETFSTILSWSLDGDATLFTADTSSGYRALMRSVNGQISTLVDSDQTWTDGNRFNYIGHMRTSAGSTVFRAYTDDIAERLYKISDQGIGLLVDERMPPPDGSSPTYGGFVDFAYANDTLVFEAGNGAMYTNFGGSMSRVIGPGDTLDGKKILNLTFYEHGFDGTTAVFWVIFEGDSSFHYDRAIYTVTIPAPGAAGLALFSALALSTTRRRPPAPRPRDVLSSLLTSPPLRALRGPCVPPLGASC